jgi:hypothetical protein
MRTAVDKVGRGKDRTVNTRFLAMTSHYLFEAEFCNPASGIKLARPVLRPKRRFHSL